MNFPWVGWDCTWFAIRYPLNCIQKSSANVSFKTQITIGFWPAALHQASIHCMLPWLFREFEEGDLVKMESFMDEALKAGTEGLMVGGMLKAGTEKFYRGFVGWISPFGEPSTNILVYDMIMISYTTCVFDIIIFNHCVVESLSFQCKTLKNGNATYEPSKRSYKWLKVGRLFSIGRWSGICFWKSILLESMKMKMAVSSNTPG